MKKSGGITPEMAHTIRNLHTLPIAWKSRWKVVKQVDKADLLC
jgi:hypothetical protein